MRASLAIIVFTCTPCYIGCKIARVIPNSRRNYFYQRCCKIRKKCRQADGVIRGVIPYTNLNRLYYVILLKKKKKLIFVVNLDNLYLKIDAEI